MKKKQSSFQKLTKRYGNPKDVQQLKSMMAYNKLCRWRKFLWGWQVSGYNLRFPFIYYKLWRKIK